MAKTSIEKSSCASYLLDGSYRVVKIIIKGGSVLIICASAISGAPSFAMGAKMMCSGCEVYGASLALDAIAAVGTQVLYHPKASLGILSSAGLISFCKDDFLKMCVDLNQVLCGVGSALYGLFFRKENEENGDIVAVSDGEEFDIQLLPIVPEGLTDGEQPGFVINFLDDASDDGVVAGIQPVIISFDQGGAGPASPVLAVDSTDLGEIRDGIREERDDGSSTFEPASVQVLSGPDSQPVPSLFDAVAGNSDDLMVSGEGSVAEGNSEGSDNTDGWICIGSHEGEGSDDVDIVGDV